MGKLYWLKSWPRFLLWSHVIGVVGFYFVIWLRTAPRKEDRVKKLPLRSENSIQSINNPLVSVIVPARNEERNIRRCVTSLLEQDYEHCEVIVVDDGSSDDTPRILDELIASHPRGDRLFVLRLRDDLPEGWAGKPHAIHAGTQEAHGKWFLFTDADTWHAPNALRSSLAQAREEQVDLFTIGSEQELPTFWDKVMMPMVYLGISMLYPPKQVNDPLSKVAIANGQYILIRREVYEALGGYARPELRNTLLDDRDLARVVKEQGYKLHFVDGRGLVSVHMYHSLGEIWRGWRKNAYLGNRGGIGFFVLQLIGLPIISILPFLLPLLARLTRTRRYGGIGPTEALAATGLELTSLLAYRTWLNKQMRVPWRYSLLHPLAGAILEGILAQSSWRILTGSGVDWRGRNYYNEASPKSRSQPRQALIKATPEHP
jgi:chlorobactene glucosyltransferase